MKNVRAEWSEAKCCKKKPLPCIYMCLALSVHAHSHSKLLYPLKGNYPSNYIIQAFTSGLVSKMRGPILALSLMAASTMADMGAFTNANSFGAMLKRGDTIMKRQGYSPDTTFCGRGNTCAEACGTGSVECPSTDTSMLYCHDSTDGSVRHASIRT